MAKIPVCLKNNRVIHIEGEIIHIWTVAPVVGRLGNGAIVPRETAWGVRSLQFGVHVAVFKDRDIAVNFAGWLWRNYGDITQTLTNNYNKAETPEDAAILDEIHERANHQTRITKSNSAGYPGLFD